MLFRRLRLLRKNRFVAGLVVLIAATCLMHGTVLADESAPGHVSALYLIEGEGVRIEDISLDGSTVVGEFRNADGNIEGFVWSIDAGFRSLGSLGGTATTISTARAVSADGSVVVGYARTAEQVSGRGRNRTVIPERNEAFLWTADAGMVSLGSLGGSSGAYGVSADGTVVAGDSVNADGVREPFRWTPDSGMTGVGTLGGTTRVYLGSGGSPISADGSTIIGRGWDGTQHTAFVWTLAGGMQAVPTVHQLPYLSWHGTSAAGYTSAGTYVDEAYIWTQENGPLGIGTVGDRDHSEPQGISADGSMIVGWSASDNWGWHGDELEMPHEAFTWDWTEGMRALPKPFDDISAGAWGVSLDSAVIAGGVFPGFFDFNEEPVLWFRGFDSESEQEVYDLHFLRDILRDGGVDLVDAFGDWGIWFISGDGNVVAGYTYEDGGYGMPFVAVLDVSKLSAPHDDEPGDDEPGDDEPGDDEPGDGELVASVSLVDVGPRGRHMDVIADVADTDGAAVAGALVDVVVEHLSSGQLSFESGTTDGDGTVSWRYSNSDASDYHAELLSISHPDYD